MVVEALSTLDQELLALNKAPLQRATLPPMAFAPSPLLALCGPPTTTLIIAACVGLLEAVGPALVITILGIFDFDFVVIFIILLTGIILLGRKLVLEQQLGSFKREPLASTIATVRLLAFIHDDGAAGAHIWKLLDQLRGHVHVVLRVRAPLFIVKVEVSILEVSGRAPSIELQVIDDQWVLLNQHLVLLIRALHGVNFFLLDEKAIVLGRIARGIFEVCTVARVGILCPLSD